MEIETLIDALEEALSYLRKSNPSNFSTMSIEEIIRRLEIEVTRAQKGKLVDVNLLERLFAPTGVIQETSIDNGWGTRFLRIAEVVDQFIGGK